MSDENNNTIEDTQNIEFEITYVIDKAGIRRCLYNKEEKRFEIIEFEYQPIIIKLDDKGFEKTITNLRKKLKDNLIQEIRKLDDCKLIDEAHQYINHINTRLTNSVLKLSVIRKDQGVRN
jgi:hypothetical protein